MNLSAKLDQAHLRTPRAGTPPQAGSELKLGLEALHDPNSGRADARRLADFLGLSVTAVARIIGRGPQTVHKTPDSRAIQGKLAVLVRIATSLATAFGSPERGRIWLNTPNDDLDKTAPLEVIKKGKSEIVAELLEDALLGHPG